MEITQELNSSLSATTCQSWKSITLGELGGKEGIIIDGDWILSKDLESGHDVRLIQLGDVGEGRFLDKTNKWISKDRSAELKCTELKSGDILVSRMASPIARACILPQLPYPTITAVDVTIIRPDRSFADASFVMWLLNSQNVKLQAEKLARGTTRKRISRKRLESLMLPLPPILEQKRIVSKIEELFTKLDAGVDYLKKARTELVRYRQSVLRAAFEGRLTEGWRTKHKDETESASLYFQRILSQIKPTTREENRTIAADQRGLYPIPENWAWLDLGSLLVDARYGTSEKCTDEASGTPVLRIPNVKRGTIDLTDLKYAKLRSDEQEKLSVKKGDLLVIRTNGSHDLVGRAALMRNSDIIFAFASYLIRLRMATDEALSEYVNFFFQTEHLRRFIESKARTTAGQFNVNLAALSSVPLPLAPPNEQHLINERIEEMLSAVEDVTKSVEDSLRTSSNLRNGILTLAFQGNLVPQDPTDDPASILLGKIGKEEEKLVT